MANVLWIIAMTKLLSEIAGTKIFVVKTIVKSIVYALKSIDCNHRVCENGEDGAIFALTSYCFRTNVGACAELPPRFGHETLRQRPMLSAPLRSRRNHAKSTLLLPFF